MTEDSFLISQMTWSYSRLTAFEQCPYQFYLHYILQQPESGQFYAQFGSLIHHLLAGYYSGILTQDQLPATYVREFRQWVSAHAPGDTQFYKFYDEGLEALRNLWVPHQEIMAVEQAVNFNVGGYPFVGFIDLVLKDGDNLVLCDHKSHPLKPRSARRKPTKTDEELDRYLRQLYLYACAAESLYGQLPSRLVFNCYRSGAVIDEPFNHDQYQKTLDWAVQLIHQIEVCEDWYADNEFFRCRNICGFRRMCEYF